MQVDYENFAKGIERGTYEVWSKLTRKQRKAILKTIHDGWNALLELESAGLGSPVITVPNVVSPCEPIVKTIDTYENSDPIVQSVDINTMPTSDAGVAGANNKDQPKVMSNFCHLVSYPVFNSVDIFIPRKFVKKVSSRFENTLYGYFIGKRMVFLVFESQSRLEAVLEGGPWLIIFEEYGISLIASFIGKPVMIDSYTSSICNDSWGRSSFAWCLIEVNSEADLVKAVTIGIPSLIEEDFTKETIRVEYEWRPPRCDECKIIGHVHDQCPKKVVSPPIVATPNVVNTSIVVTHTVENDGFQAVGKKKKKKGNASISSSLLKNKVTSSHQDNITSSNSFSALNVEDEEEEKEVENVYDETANLLNTKIGHDCCWLVCFVKLFVLVHLVVPIDVSVYGMS
ncbi:zinc knuckle CX2CX4HX4C containing protein [Tanacetum coccineum]